MVDDGRTTDGRRTDGRTTEHGYTISSPCEPDGSGELTKMHLLQSQYREYILDEPIREAGTQKSQGHVQALLKVFNVRNTLNFYTQKCFDYFSHAGTELLLPGF